MWQERMTQARSVAGKIKYIGILSSGSLLSALLGLAMNSVIAHHWGAGASTDSYFMARSIGAFFNNLFLFSQISIVLLNAFRQQQSSREAWRLLSSFLSLLVLLVGVLGLLAYLCGPWLVRFFAPGYTGERQVDTAGLLILMVPATLFSSISTYTVAVIFNAFADYHTPVLLNLAARSAGLAAMLLFGSRGIGVVAGIVFAANLAGLALPVLALRRYGPVSLLVNPFGRDATALLSKYRTFLPTLAASSLARWAYRVAASSLTLGTFSALSYAESFFGFLTQFVSASTSQVAVQEFAGLAPAERASHLRERALANVRFFVLLALPIVGFLVIEADNVIRLLLGRGAFLKSHALPQTALALRLYAVLLIPTGLNQVLGGGLISCGLMASYVRYSCLNSLLRAALLLVLPLYLAMAGLLMSDIVASSVNLICLLRAADCWPSSATYRPLLLRLGAIFALLLAMRAGLGLVLAERAVGPGELDQLLLVGASVLTWFGAYLLLGKLFRIAEIEELWRLPLGRSWATPQERSQ